MEANNINNLGKEEKNQKVKSGKCIFPFKYKYQSHDECVETEKGKICATSVNKNNTLETYGYCIEKKKNSLKTSKTSKSKIDMKKHKNKTIKIKQVSMKKSKSKSLSKSSSSSPVEDTEKHEYNTEFISLLDQLNKYMLKKGEPFRARAYQKAMESIMVYKEPIYTVKQIEHLPGIGKTIIEKLNEYLKTGKLKAIEKEKENPLHIFTEVYGIGPKKAEELIKKGITSIAELRKNQELLNNNQIIGLKYYEEILERIPRAEIDEYAVVLQKCFDEIAPAGSESKFEIVGSYRRGALNSGDIDIIITNNQNNKEVFDRFIDILVEKKILLELLSRGNNKSLTIGKLPGKNKIARRLDFLYSPPNEYAFAVLYFTGSKIFNTVMRHRALEMGYSLNEHGFTKIEHGKKTHSLDMYFPDEKSIFQFLQMKFKEPKDRRDGRDIEIIINKQEINKIVEEPLDKPVEKPEIKVHSTKLQKTLKVQKFNYKKTIDDFKKHGVDILNELTEKELESIIKQANKAYYNENTLMTDNQYDIIKEYMEKKYPSNNVLQEIGAPIEKNKVKLPYQMPSMDKIKPDTNALKEWVNKYKGPYVLSCKLDGVSGMFSNESGTPKLYTRGNGKEGQDISHLVKFFKELDLKEKMTLRGEFIISKDKFAKDFSGLFSNSRNFVAGVINSKTVEKNKVNALDFVIYEVIHPSLKPSEQIKFLKQHNLKIVKHKLEEKLSNELLSETLVDWRENYEYEIDGVIVTDDKIYPRKSGNPEHAFAFKMVLSDQVAEAKVLDVLWSPSKDGYLKPRIHIEPVVLGGAKIEYATGFNAAFIVDNKIGIGSVVKIVRSGDVIPHILDVLVKSKEPKLPDIPYEWNPTHIDIIMKNKEQDDTVKEKIITNFFKGVNVEGIGSGNVKKIMKAGYNDICQIIKMKKEDFLKVEGFKDKTASKLSENIRKQINESGLTKIIAVSNILGRGLGEKKLDLIMEDFPDILTKKETVQEKIVKVNSVKGMAEKTTTLFVENIPAILDFLKNCDLLGKLESKPVNINNNNDSALFKKNIVMSGFRDKELVAKLTALGANNASSVSKTTFALIVKDKDESTGKIEQAKKLNIPIYNIEEFVKKYL